MVAEQLAMPRDATLAVIDTMLDTVTAALARGEDVRLVGFGNFVVAARKASSGRNPRTGEPMDLPACRSPKFRVGRNLKVACNNVD